MSICNWASMAYSLAGLFRVTTYKANGWDTGYVRATIDIIKTIDTLMTNMIAAGAMLGFVHGSSGNESYSRVIHQFKSFKGWLEIRLQSMAPPNCEGLAEYDALKDDEIGANGFDVFDVIDDSFWQNCMVI